MAENTRTAKKFIVERSICVCSAAETSENKRKKGSNYVFSTLQQFQVAIDDAHRLINVYKKHRRSAALQLAKFADDSPARQKARLKDGNGARR